MSHPSWVCGLKQDIDAFAASIPKSHPSWVCGLKPNMDYDSNLDKCHTLRGCVDWNTCLSINPRSLKVTPFVGVWIETYQCMLASLWVYGHTLRGCVDWNPVGHKREKQPTGHTLRGCVDWNVSHQNRFSPDRSHTLRGCVDWNISTSEAMRLGLSHTLRGCVDWNYFTKKKANK